MGYSKISSMELINFMSFKKARISFDETGIINIKGYNDSGKSAILRGIAVCLMDMFKHKQLKFIRHKEEYFRVVVTFDDGVSILRDKYITGQSLYEVYKGQDLVFTTKQGNRLSKIDGVPKPIADYLGLCITDSVYLNYQSCIDKLPVVDTTGSENYQMFHEVLRMEEIFRANNMINIDKNDLGLEISTMEVAILQDEALLNNCGDVSKEFIDIIQQLEDESTETNKKKETLDNISKIYSGYENIKVLPSIEKISTDRLSRVYDIGKIVSTLDKKVTIPSIEKVPVDRLGSLYSIMDKVDKLQKYVVIPEIPRVDETLVSKKNSIGNIIKVYKDLEKQNSMCSSIDSRLENLRGNLNKLVLEAKKQGIELVKCENCGCYTEAGGNVHE